MEEVRETNTCHCGTKFTGTYEVCSYCWYSLTYGRKPTDPWSR